MKTALRVVGVLTLVLLGLVVAHSIFSPYVAWYFVVPAARLTVNGRAASGSLHRGRSGETLFVTRRDKKQAESYMVSAPHDGRGIVWNCGTWTAPRIPAFPIGDVNPPCLFGAIVEGSDSRARVPPRDLTTGNGFVEFTADDGSRIRASW